MPELPEVEITRLGLLPHLAGQSLQRMIFRTPKLRYDLPSHLPPRLAGLTLSTILRRGKYLLFDFEHEARGGWLIVHLGMSGSLRILPHDTPPQKHDHVDWVFARHLLRFHDPRRFGAVLWHEGEPIAAHPLLAHLGIEPLSAAFDGNWLYKHTRGRTTPIKTLLMDSHIIVGVGNIYAAESLFSAGISPWREAGKISRARCQKLATAIRETLEKALEAGGSTLRNYVQSNGERGFFQLSCQVYGRKGLPCLRCAQPVLCTTQAGRSSFYCAHCQR